MIKCSPLIDRRYEASAQLGNAGGIKRLIGGPSYLRPCGISAGGGEGVAEEEIARCTFALAPSVIRLLPTKKLSHGWM